ncbi:SH3 domain-containing protein [Microbulbifer sp. CAU 1566]|uniref:SH3 domain-containing protein n=1 Tax=Microbulbifer sp. CAU 1566 TaxID=2933269 RepID=UPI0020051FD9|nr:SH3 domain-containing protein [Microbulbifer sp. CAU 1566]MCK7596458.1 SH3 domain-containing protein [Microbulbifer sp. CAU 1566]
MNKKLTRLLQMSQQIYQRRGFVSRGAFTLLFLASFSTHASVLENTAWRLSEFRSMSDEVGSLRPDNPLSVQIRFGADGTASMQLDCNRGSARWQLKPSTDPSNGQFELGPVGATLALCQGNNLGEKFARDAPMLRGYMVRDGRLSLSLMADAGIYIFDPIPPKASVEQGGPRVWKVTEAPSGLNLRSAASASASIVGRFANGERLDNLGCETAGGRLWCNVQQFGGGPVGYVAADYLSPAIAPDGSMPAGTDDSALRAGKGDFDATGKVPCGDQWCEFGVARAGGGFATVVITRTDGMRRALFFRMGIATGADTAEADGQRAFSARREDDNYLIRVGPERYKIPDAVIFGG